MQKIAEEHDKIWEPYNFAYARIESFIQNYTSKQQLTDFENTRVNTDKQAFLNLRNLSFDYQPQANIKNL